MRYKIQRLLHHSCKTFFILYMIVCRGSNHNRIRVLLARLFPHYFSPPLTDEQLRAIYEKART